MIDRDLAELYGVETKRLNEAVKRNIERFPSDFMFQLTDEEWKNLRSQIATFSEDTRKYKPYVFTATPTTLTHTIYATLAASSYCVNFLHLLLLLCLF